MNNISHSTTIAAISSGQVPAAIGVIRISGPKALPVVTKCLKKKDLKPRMMHSRKFFHPDTGAKLDDVLVCYFKGPHSFTGEDSVEVYAHGGSINLGVLLDAVIHAGAVHAQPGEFSKRAFLNGKLDLSEAEAIMDIIHAQNEVQCREAQRQLSGSVSSTVVELRSLVMDMLCRIEATIDFSQEEELAPMPVDMIKQSTARVIDQIARLKRSHDQYRAGGLRTVLMGRPNAGKSSLFNRLLGHERAIVTQIAGTTTDTIEATATIGSHAFCLIDTAGITQTDNPIEAIGVQRAKDQIRNADILIALIDGTSEDDSILDEISEILGNDIERFINEGRFIVVHTKSDIALRPPLSPRFSEFMQQHHLTPMDISTVSHDGLTALEERLIQISNDIRQQFEDVTLVTSQRHITLLEDAAQSLARAKTALDSGLPAECIAADMHDAAQSLGAITGAFASEDIINEIFSHFCIGK